MGRQVLASIGTAIANDAGDPMLNAAILVWNAVKVPWTDAWFQFPIYYPAADALTFSEHLLGVSVIATPVYWLTGNGLTTYNLTLLLTYPLCGLAMYALVWRLTRSGGAAFLSGLAFAFAPYRVTQLTHIQILAVFWAPLALLGLHAYIDTGRNATGRKRWLALFAASWMLQGAANGYFLVYFTVVVGLWVLWFVAARRRWRELGTIVGAGAAATLPLAPILYRYATVHARYGFTRPLEEVESFGADLAAPLCAPGLAVWGWVKIACRPEGELFVGPTILVLCFVGAWAAYRRRARVAHTPIETAFSVLSGALMVTALFFIGGGVAVALGGPWRLSIGPIHASAAGTVKPFSNGVRLLLIGLLCSRAVWAAMRRGSIPAFYLLAAVATWALSWGTTPMLQHVQVLPEGPFAWLRLLPGVEALRVPARFWMMTILCLSVLMGTLLARVKWRTGPVSALALALAAGGLIADGWMTIPAVQPPRAPPRPDILRGELALTLPIGRMDSTAEFYAVAGGWSSVNGASGYDAKGYELLREASRYEDAATLLAPFLARRDLHVIVDEDAPRLVAIVERQPGATETARGNGRRQYRIPRQR